ncbi:MAG: DUF4121 family protein [Deltaproteobacteria bacterium]|nr:DUF4121 family protein [Deltaproteobacteria bacterium]
MESLFSLHKNIMNYNHIRKYGISQVDVEMINWSISLIESTRNKLTPIKGDIIQLSAPGDGKIRYMNGHLDRPIGTEFASICTQGSPPFILVKGDDFSFSKSGGYWTREQELEMYEYIGMEKKIFCQWGECGMCANGAIYFHAIVNTWRLIREDIY